MKKIPLTPIMLAIAALASACSSLPTSTSLLDQTRSEYRAAQSNPGVANYAPLEMKQAGDALAQANAAASNNDSAEKIDKLAYLARQKIALTQEVVKQKSAEASVAGAVRQRDQIRLEQRTNEANRAQASADQATFVARMAVDKANAAERETRDAQNAAANAQRKTQDAEAAASEAQLSMLDAQARTAQLEAQARTAQLEAQARAAQLEAQLADMAAKQTERGMVITLGDVLFGTDMARMNPEGMRTAQKLADFLQKYPQRTVLIEGFTDSIGSVPHNQELSERRATAVRSALQELGVGRERIVIHGYGESYPIASNNTAENRQLNRRVEIVLSDASGKVMQR